MDDRKVSKSKRDPQGHKGLLYCCHSMGHMQVIFISIPLQLCIYLAPLKGFHHLLAKSLRGHFDPGHIVFRSKLLCMN